MAERFQKTYISVHEFVNSWEKEIYELTNLDYFTYLLINGLAYQIEHDFQNRHDNNPYLKLEQDEIGTLAFNIGDSFENFLQNNCFGDCSLSCPTCLNERVTPGDSPLAENHHHILQILGGQDFTKRQYLITDILNYVVIDTLFDFYNYEVGLDLDDTDIGLLQFADFIADILERIIEQHGQQLLAAPDELANDQFEFLLQEGNDDWEEPEMMMPEEEDSSDDWKLGTSNIDSLIEQYLLETQFNKRYEIRQKALEMFQKYMAEYAGIVNSADITAEDIYEFFDFWLVRELTIEPMLNINDMFDSWQNFFTWLEITQNLELLSDKIMKDEYRMIYSAVEAGRSYNEKFPLIESLLRNNDEIAELVSGYFKIVSISSNGLVKLEDIHLHKTFINVQLDSVMISHIAPGFIFDGSLKPTGYGWRLVQLDFVFPPSSLPFIN